jgi:hypothetical protein
MVRLSTINQLPPETTEMTAITTVQEERKKNILEEQHKKEKWVAHGRV